MIVRGAAGADSVTVTMASTPSLAYEGWEDRIKAGAYTVTVREPGYADWTASNVRVVSEGCHVAEAVHLTASLVRITP